MPDYTEIVQDKFERVLNQSVVRILSADGFQQDGTHFWLKIGRIGRVVQIHRNSSHRQMAVFTFHAKIYSDDFWDLEHPDEPLPDRWYDGWQSMVFHKNVGDFFGKNRGTQWLTGDALTNEEEMIARLNHLMTRHILPYLNKFSTIDDILDELEHPSVRRMIMLGWLGRRAEAYAELTHLIAHDHQTRRRLNYLRVARRYRII